MRLGLHAHSTHHDDLWRRYVERVRPPICKRLADGWSDAIVDHAHAHGTKIVGRMVDHISNQDDMGPSVSRALAWGAQRGWRMDYLEWANEEWQGRDRITDWDHLCRYGLKFLQGVDAARVATRGCVLNCSTGQPEIERWTREPARALLAYAAARGHAIGLHEYYRPVPWEGVHGGIAGTRGWWMLRVQRAVEVWRAQGASPRVIITESGRDAVSGTPGEGAGWRDDPGAPYDQHMKWYLERVTAIPEVIGVVDFGFSSGDRWASFDLAAAPGMLDKVADAMVTLPIGGTMPTGTRAGAAKARWAMEEAARVLEREIHYWVAGHPERSMREEGLRYVREYIVQAKARENSLPQ